MRRRRRSKATVISSTIPRSARSRSCAGRRRVRGPSTSTRAIRAARPKARSSANGRATSSMAATPPSAATTSSRTATSPAAPMPRHARDPKRILLWHANYHPDGGQLFFPLDSEAVPGPARAARRRRRAREIRLLPLRRQPGPLHSSEHLARGRVRHVRVAAILRPAGRRARAGVGRFRARVRMPARSADRIAHASAGRRGPLSPDH